MDVRKHLLGVAAIFVLSACSQPKTEESVFQQQSNSCGGQQMDSSFIVEWEDGRVSIEKSPNPEEFKKTFVRKNLTNIRKVHHNKLITLNTITHSDNSASAQFGPGQWGITMTEPSALWNSNIKGQNVVVGVVDTTVDFSHPQLYPRQAINQNEIPNNNIDDDKNGYIDDVYGVSFVRFGDPAPSANGHGTHVAGIVSADPSFGSLSGVAPESKIVQAPFLGGENGRGSLGDAMLAMDYVASRGAKIINASWGGANCDLGLYDSFKKISNRGVMIIVAAGNEGIDLDRSPTYPAAFSLPTQITVAASNANDYMPYFSNSGFSAVQIASPGDDILSTFPNNSSRYLSGTSMAAPFVAGAAALLWSARPNATAVQIKSAILKGVDVRPGHEFRVSTQGRLNIRKSFDELRRLVP